MNLLIHQAALGDWVLTFPILRALHPQPTIAVSTGAKARLAARLFPHVQALDIDLPGWSALFTQPEQAAATPPPPPMGKALKNARRIISFVGQGDDFWAANLRRLAPNAHHLFIASCPPDDWTGHVHAWHDHQFRAHGLTLPDSPAPPDGNPAGPVVIHPGSGGRAKCWPRDHFETLILALRRIYPAVLPILGEVEAETWPRETFQRWTSELGAATPLSLEALADTLRGARLFVGNDAGPTHLAAQMGISTLALFGPSLPNRWAPIGPRVTVLAPPSPRAMDWLEVGTVLDACRDIMC